MIDLFWHWRVTRDINLANCSYFSEAKRRMITTPTRGNVPNNANVAICDSGPRTLINFQLLVPEKGSTSMFNPLLSNSTAGTEITPDPQTKTRLFWDHTSCNKFSSYQRLQQSSYCFLTNFVFFVMFLFITERNFWASFS